MLKTVYNTASNITSKNTKIYAIAKQYYPGNYRARAWKDFSKNTESFRDDLGLTKHQATHVNIEETLTKKIVAIFTSSKGKNADTTIHFEKLDPVKYDGTFIPLKDPITKQITMDTDGKAIPDPDKGGQYIAVLVKSRRVCKDAQPYIKEEKKYQDYLDKHEFAIKKIVENGSTKTTSYPPKNIGGKDDE